MEYIITLYFWEIGGKAVHSYMFKFDSMIDALQFATTVTDHFHGIERVDVQIKWSINEK